MMLELGWIAAAAAAAVQDPAEAAFQEKLRYPFLSKAEWITDFDAARERAQRAGKLIFAYFTIPGP